MTPRARAIQEQLLASDPAVSAFVAASAGSGKTKLLTDRMLRLMLGGAPPGRVQCLTFTKAAAAEMALRLQHRLGRWVTLDDAALDRELSELQVPASTAIRTAARALFAQVLDLPGGMRIGTIHAFCQSLLRRFPLEAAISPQFRLVEDADVRLAMDRAREGVLATADPAALGTLAGLVDAEEFSKLIMTLSGMRTRLADALAMAEPRLEAAVRRVIGERGTEADVMADAPAVVDGLADALRTAQAHGSPGVRDSAAAMLAWLGMPDDLRRAHWDDWVAALFTEKQTPRALSKFAAGKLALQYPEIHVAAAAEQARVAVIEDRRRAVRAADATIALLRIAAPILRAFEEGKAFAGQLDYSDLITRTSSLLIDPGAAWVLYKLDGGIDHLLLDEVQDTAPEQWQIAHRLTDEFFAGLGAKGDTRTFFAVGDPKQSIYSFQGADPDEFDRSRAQMAARVGASGQVWRDVTLDVSFRSTAPVLALVDAVFAQPLAKPGVADDTVLQHFPDRAGAGGQVELWPLAPAPPKVDAEPWAVPDENQGLVSAPQRLADTLAAWIGGEIADGVMLESQGRALAAGDVLVLVRRRNAFAQGLVRALKARGVPVAGLDRLALTEQPAVQDLLAACDAVLLPEDDLAVACVLTSPLGGLDDDSLMRLAHGRPGSLWDTLRSRATERPAWGAAWRFLQTLQSRADHVTPHALLSEALGPLGGRARLLARLGPEAAEPMDELLNAALSYAAAHPPSLQGFVHWLRRSGAEVKREAGGSGGAVRIMTVHGAKGLQAPLVILPDTTALPPDDDDFTWAYDEPSGTEIPLWSVRKDLRPAAIEANRTAARRRAMREQNRLLYVGLTRAEDRLVVCGWQMKNAPPEESWYALVQAGFAALPHEAVPFEAPGAWEGERLVYRTAQSVPVPVGAAEPVHAPAAIPGWAGQGAGWRPAPPPGEPALPRPLAPSRPDGAAFGPIPRPASPLMGRASGRFQHGNSVHTLLQHLPAVPEAARMAAAQAHVAGLPPEAAVRVVREVFAVLAHPALQALFGPEGRAEQPLAGLIGGAVITGVVDRMAVRADGVWIADYKTNRATPTDVADTPVRYLRQLAAYRSVIRAIYPDRPVHCALVWTESADVVTIPDALLDAHAPGLIAA